MGFFRKFFLIGGIVLFAYSYQKFQGLFGPIDAPKFDLNFYWGPGNAAKYKENKAIVPFKNLVPPNSIEKLKEQLSVEYDLPAPLEGVNCEYGMNTVELKKIVNYWRDIYLPKWSEREAHLMSLPHFTTEIQGLRIHFIHLKVASNAKNKKVYPLLLLHGWPGSVIELYEVAKKLNKDSDGKDYLFEIVIPSIPGYGWSQAASKKHLGSVEVSVIFRNLMKRLGYNKFFIQGGDWGSLIGNYLTTLFPDEVIGYHSNACFTNTLKSNLKGIVAAYWPSFFAEEKYQNFYFPSGEKFLFLLQESGYLHLQATKPDTIGTVLSTSNPIGLAAYILEKFSTWTNPDYRNVNGCGLGKDFTYDQLLDNVMIYYLTDSILTSVRLYSESFSARSLAFQLDRIPTPVPTACARFKNDLMHPLDWQLKDKFTNLLHSVHYEDGGHLAAYQLPDVLYNDFLLFVDKVWKQKLATQPDY